MSDNKENSKNSMAKRVFAIIGVVLLLIMYAMTLVFAIIDNPATMDLFKASVALTIFVPVLLYAYQLVFRVLKGMGTRNVIEHMETENGEESEK